MNIAFFILYATVLLIAAYVRFWTEGGFWPAIHTGRTFMLQAATLSVGTGIGHLSIAARVNLLRPYVPATAPNEVQEALESPLSATLVEPMVIFLFGMLFLIGYILTGFSERDFLMKIGNPPIAKKYVDLSQKPTYQYKFFIGFVLWLGTLCLLVSWYFLLVSKSRGMWWYLFRVGLPSQLVIVILLWAGPKLAYRFKGTAGQPQTWDLGAIPGEKD